MKSRKWVGCNGSRPCLRDTTADAQSQRGTSYVVMKPGCISLILRRRPGLALSRRLPASKIQNDRGSPVNRWLPHTLPKPDTSQPFHRRKRRTVTADWYVHQCLSQVMHTVHTRRPKSGITFHHDNAPAHTAADTRNSSSSLIPPYSPDLAPCDLFLFPHVKKQLRGTRYDSPQDAIRAFTRAIDSIDKVSWSEVWKSWFQCMARCIEAHGGNFEKLA